MPGLCLTSMKIRKKPFGLAGIDTVSLLNAILFSVYKSNHLGNMYIIWLKVMSNADI